MDAAIAGRSLFYIGHALCVARIADRQTFLPSVLKFAYKISVDYEWTTIKEP